MTRIVGSFAGGTLPSFAAGSHVSRNNFVPSAAVSVVWWVWAAMP